MLTIAILGVGSRGEWAYLRNFSKNSDIQITALCDIRQDTLDSVVKKYALKNVKTFADENDFFNAGKLADAIVIATLDQDHYRHTKQAILLGYDILLEKPVTAIKEEMDELAELANKHNTKILVCHVLRYAPYYQKIKEIIDSGIIGDIVNINHTENIGYWHFAHSYTRGNWRNSNTTAPSLLAKSCHDMDLFNWFVDSKPLKVSSFGALKHFRKENMPTNATTHCLKGCPYYHTCPFSVKKIYLDNRAIMRGSLPNVTRLAYRPKKEEAISILSNNDYGRCVYQCDNNVCDHQIVNIEYSNGVVVSFTMTAFTKSCYRRIHIAGTKGELFGADTNNTLQLNIFGQKPKKIKVHIPKWTGHLGGDKGICKTFYQYITNKPVNKNLLTTLGVSVDSHNIVYGAEQSRKESIVVEL